MKNFRLDYVVTYVYDDNINIKAKKDYKLINADNQGDAYNRANELWKNSTEDDWCEVPHITTIKNGLVEVNLNIIGIKPHINN